MTLGLRKLAAANSYKVTLRKAYESWREAVVILDGQVAAIARGASGCAVSECWVSGEGLSKLVRARSLSLALLAAFGDGITAADTDSLMKVQGRIAELILQLVKLTEEP